MHEVRALVAAGATGMVGTARAVPSVIADGIRLRSPITRAFRLVAASSSTWGFGMVAFETLVPIRLTDLLGKSRCGRGDRRAGELGSMAGVSRRAPRPCRGSVDASGSPRRPHSSGSRRVPRSP